MRRDRFDDDRGTRVPGKKTFAALSATAALMLAAPASAGVANDYQGRAEKDKTTFVGFDVAKKNGVKRVSKVTGILHYHCSASGTDPTFGVRSQGSLKVKDNRFGGTLKIPIQQRGGLPTSAKVVINGKLGRKGKASGVIEGIVVFADTGRRGIEAPPEGRCYTGGLSYRLKRGAEVNPPPFRPGTRSLG